MILTVNGKTAVDIADAVMHKLLSLYPEERLHERSKFKEAFQRGFIEFRTLQRECDVIAIPWQMFLLEEALLEKEIQRIEANRATKLTEKIADKRTGVGSNSSRRILDRLISLQNFTTKSKKYIPNRFIGSLKNMSTKDAADYIVSYFNINMDIFRNRPKDEALKYLIKVMGTKQINICQGVLKNRILPQAPSILDVYRNTSGLSLRDDCIPFIFLPSETNPDERDGRQIYTLMYLTVQIGLDAYGYIIQKDLSAQILKADSAQEEIHAIVGEILLPAAFTNELHTRKVTEQMRDTLASKHKITPTAVVTILRKRSIITEKEYRALLPRITPTLPTQNFNQPSVKTSAKKFVGEYSFDAINSALRAGTLRPIQAQYLIFGFVNKKSFRQYKKEIGI